MDRDKIKKILRKEMKKVNGTTKGPLPEPFAFCFAQARFDILMNIDRELELGAFYRKGK